MSLTENATAPATERNTDSLSPSASVLRTEWIDAVDQLIGQVQTWCSEHPDWATKRTVKTLKEAEIGKYEIPQLLIHTLQGRLLLDPLGRMMSASRGTVELSKLPSFEGQLIFRLADGWQTGTFDKREPWGREAFHRAVDQLLHADL